MTTNAPTTSTRAHSVAFSDTVYGIPAMFSPTSSAGIQENNPITLFGADQSIAAAETLPFRTTTYEPKMLTTTPLLKGNLYVQDPLELTQRTMGTVNLNAMTWSQLYSTGFNHYLSSHRRQAEMRGTVLPPAPPDFEAEQPTNPELVSQYVNGLAAAYSAPMESPTPFQMCSHVIGQLVQLSAVSAQQQSSSSGTIGDSASGGGNDDIINRDPATQQWITNATAGGGVAAAVATVAVGGQSQMLSAAPSASFLPNVAMDAFGGGTSGYQSPIRRNESCSHFVRENQNLSSLLPSSFPAVSAVHLEAANLAITLSNPTNLNGTTLGYALQSLRKQTDLAALLPSETVDSLLQLLRDSSTPMSGGGIAASFSPEQRSILACVLVTIVLQRQQLGEVLQLAQALEAMPRVESTSIVPNNVIPQLPMDLLDTFTLGPFPAQSSSCSPLDVLHQESKPMPTMIPEGVAVQRFCVSSDGKCIAIATASDGVFLCDAKSGDLITFTSIPSGLGSCWMLQFNTDDSELLYSDHTGKHHALFTVKGLLPSRRFDFDDARIPRFSRDGQLSFAPAPFLARGHNETACIRFFSSERVNIPISSSLTSQNIPAATTIAVTSTSNMASSPMMSSPSGSVATSGEVQSPSVVVAATASSNNPTVGGPSNAVSTAAAAAAATAIPTTELCIATIVDSGFQGIVTTIDGGDEMLSLQLRGGVVILAHGAGSCQALLPPKTGWVFLCAHWKAGVWTLILNDTLSELKGVRIGQSKQLRLQQAYGLCGTGSIACVAAWCGPPARPTLRSLLTSNVLVAHAALGVRPLFHLPLDEGGGVWLKETVHRTVVTISPNVAVWDSHTSCKFATPSSEAMMGSGISPLPPASSGSPLSAVNSNVAGLRGNGGDMLHHNGQRVQIPSSVLLQAHVLQSHFQVVLILPPSQKGVDGLVLVLSQDATRIERIYQDSGSDGASVDAPLLYVNREETTLYSFAPRFGSFTVTSISSARKRADVLCIWEDEFSSGGRGGGARGAVSSGNSITADLTEDSRSSPIASVDLLIDGSNGVGGAAAAAGGRYNQFATPQWVAERLHRVLFVEGTQLLRISSALSPINARNMVTVCAGLRHCGRKGTSKTKILSLLTLGIVHFVHLSREHDSVVQNVASVLNVACKQILAEHADDPLINDVATELFRVGVSKSLTPAHKAEVLCNADLPKNGDILEGYLSKDSIMTIANYLCREDNNTLLQVTEGLLRRCELERVKADVTGAPITPLMLWFVLAVAQSCHAQKRESLFRSVVMLFVDHADAIFAQCNSSPLLMNTSRTTTSTITTEDGGAGAGGAGGISSSPNSNLGSSTTTVAALNPNNGMANSSNSNAMDSTLNTTWLSLQQSVIHSGFVPLLVIAAQLMPSVFDDDVERRLRRITSILAPLRSPLQQRGGYSSDNSNVVNSANAIGNEAAAGAANELFGIGNNSNGSMAPSPSHRSVVSLQDIRDVNCVSPTPPMDEGNRIAAFQRPTLSNPSIHFSPSLSGGPLPPLPSGAGAAAPPPKSGAAGAAASSPGANRVSFSTRQACDIVPAVQNSVWRMYLDFSQAVSVSFTKEAASADVILVAVCPGASANNSLFAAPPSSAAGMAAPSISTLISGGGVAAAAVNPTTPSGMIMGGTPSGSGPMASPIRATSNVSESNAAGGGAGGGGGGSRETSTSLMRKTLNSANPSVKLDGGSYVLFGTGETSLTIICQYDLHVETDYTVFLRDVLFNTLVKVARHLLVRPPPSDVFLAPVMRHGLCQAALERNRIYLHVDRIQEPTVAIDVFRGVGEGKAIMDQLIRSMRGAVSLQMRPAVQALLAILIHTGSTPAQAEDELKLRWFSGEWGSRLQGEEREGTRAAVVALAEWILSSVHNVSSATANLSPIRRSSSSDRRASDFLGRSSLGLNRSSLSSSLDRRSSTSTRRSTSKTGGVQAEVLEVVRTIISKNITPAALEETLAQRTRASITIAKGLSILSALVCPEAPVGPATMMNNDATAGQMMNTNNSNNSTIDASIIESAPIFVNGVPLPIPPPTAVPAATPANQSSFSALPSSGGQWRLDCTDREYNVLLDTLWDFMSSDGMSSSLGSIAAGGSGSAVSSVNTPHVIEPLIGCGGDLEMAVRKELHVVLAACSRGLLEDASTRLQAASAQQLLTQPATKGRRIMQLLALLCHPWDSTDCEFLVQRDTTTSLLGSRPSRILSHLEELSRLNIQLMTPPSPPPAAAAASTTGATPSTTSMGVGSQTCTTALDEKLIRGELMGIADEASLNRLYPNSLSVTIPSTQLSRSDLGIVVERGQAGGATLRADEGWPLTWCEGLPRVFYFEVTLQSPVYRLAVSLTYLRASDSAGGGSGGNNNNSNSSGSSSNAKQSQDTPVFSYDNAGGATNEVGGPPFGEGDTVGCGVIASTRRVFFTINGVFLGFVGKLSERMETIFPAVIVENQESVRFVVNFGTRPFHYDFRQLHPSLSLQTGPTVARIATTAASVLHVLTARACSSYDMKRGDARMFFLSCNAVVCESVNRIAAALMALGADAAASLTPTGGVVPGVGPDFQSVIDAILQRAGAAVRISVSEVLILKILATLRHIVNMVSSSYGAVVLEDVNTLIFKAVSVLMVLPLHSVKIATIGLLPEVLPLVRDVKDDGTCSLLVRTLFEHAKTRLDNGAAREPLGNEESPRIGEGGGLDERVPFVPAWLQCDSRCMSITTAQHAHMVPDAQRSIVLGSVLPRTGIVSFTVRITREGMTKGHSLKGGYFVGVAIANLAPLSPPSNSQSWKVIKPPVVWALHDTSPQLPHAVNPTVRPNNFQRTFGSGDVITVVVNRDAQTVAFYRDDVFLKELYQDVPQNLDLAPFAQLYNDDAVVDIGPGDMTPAITSHMLLSAASVDVLRSMFTLRPFEDHVARHLTEELAHDRWPSVTLSVFASLPDPRCLTLRHGVHEETPVVVRRVNEVRCKFTLGETTYYDHLQNLRTPAQPTIRGKLDVTFSGAVVDGIMKCIDATVSALSRLVTGLVTIEALDAQERGLRQELVNEEMDAWDTLFISRRVSWFDSVTNWSRSNLKEISRSPLVPQNYVFSQPLSHSGFSFSPRYCGRLVTVPNGASNVTTPYIAIAEPSIPLQGKFSVRCQLIRGHHGQILGGGYYFGVCASTFTCKRREMNVVPPDVWALHDMEDSPWRLRHLTVDRRLPTAAEPNCLLVSGDIVRLEIDRDEGTMHAYRKPANSSDEVFIGFIYDNLPKAPVELFPFVHLYNTDAVAVILPSTSTVPGIRTVVQQPCFALSLGERRSCDGCVSQHRETKLAGQQEWFKCNDCVDYNLCGFCFGNFVHSHHAFTKMDGRMLVHTKLPPSRVVTGMSLMVPGTSAPYLKSVTCRLPQESMSCVAQSQRDDSMCTWGIVNCLTEDPFFTIYVESKDAGVLSTNRPVFVGVGDAQEILTSSSEELRKRCMTGFATGISVCSDSRVRRKMLNTSISPYGFSNGSTITITIQHGQSRAKITRDWIEVGFIALPQNFTPQSRLVGFVLFGSANIVASVAPERVPYSLVTVTEVIGNELIRVTDPGGLSRYTPIQATRVPVIANTNIPRPDQTYFAFLEKTLSVCRVVLVEKNEAVVSFVNENAVSRIGIQQLFVPVSGEVVMSEPTATTADGIGAPQGASVMTGFVISRLLMVLSCMLEDQSLVPLLLKHSATLLPLLHRLASVRVSNEAPMQFLTEVRAAIANTAQVPRIQRLLQKNLAPFIPTANPEMERTVAFQVRAGMIVSIIEGPLRGAMFRAQGDGTDTFRAEPLDGGPLATIKAAACVPVKQCAGQPWWRVPDGLPCSLVEHTVRSEVASTAPTAKCHVSLEGEWHGELITSQNASMSMSLSLRVDPALGITGTARVTIPDGRVIETKVRGEHQRYARSVRLRCSYPAVGPHMTNEEILAGLRTFGMSNTTLPTSDSTREQMLAKLAQLCENLPQPMWTLRGWLDGEGLRIVNGQWKHTEGLSGTFNISSLRGINFAPLSTPLHHVEPLPDCVDMAIPQPAARDVYATMHRVIVLLARHMYLTFVSRSAILAKEITKDVIHYHAHPLTERLIAYLVDVQPQRFYRILCEAAALVLDPNSKPWDSSTLSSIITNSVMLKPNSVEAMPSVYWDSLHAVVAAAHRCGEDYRHVVLRNIVQLIQGQSTRSLRVFSELLTTICTWVDNQASTILGITPVRRDVAAGMELLLAVPKSIADQVATSVPLAPLRCLVDMCASLAEQRALPYAVEVSRNNESSTVALDIICPFGQYADGELKVGKIQSSIRTSNPSGRYYFEVILPEKSIAAFAVGWGSQQHTDIPSQHVGSDVHSFAFSGNQVVMKQVKEEYKVGVDVATGSVIGCLLDLTEKTAAWSVNGIVGPFIPIPMSMNEMELYAFTSTGSCSGMKINLAASQFQYVPDGYCDLAGRTSGIQITEFDSTCRSSIPVRPLAFYVQVASYLSDLQAASGSSNSNSNSGAVVIAGTGSEPSSSPTSTTPVIQSGTGSYSPLFSSLPSAASAADQAAILRRYSHLVSLEPAELEQAVTVVHVAESCMSTARRFIDLEGEVVEGRLAAAFLFLKQIATRNFRRKLVEIPNVEKNINPANITIRFTELFSSLPRNAETALHHTILAQLNRQIGSLSSKQFLQSPLVKVHLYLSHSGHAPQDMGGPYRQLWSLLGDEIMAHPDKCYPHTDFHRNPLFRFVNNSQRVSLVPDHMASTPHELMLFGFLGKLLGHMARARTPLPFDFSPFVWKFLVEDILTIRDYFAHVDSVVERSVNDDEFLLSDVAEDVFPGYSDMVQREMDRRQANSQHLSESSCGVVSLLTEEELSIEVRRQVAQDCLVHSMDLQLNALREGMWTLLPQRITRCLCWQDLERAVCGDPLPTMDQMRDSLSLQVSPLREQFIWRFIDEITAAQRSALLCFACGQKRLPLVRKIRVSENAESVDHLPRAQSCSALVTIPCYTSYELFKQKMLIAIEHQTEMELA